MYEYKVSIIVLFCIQEWQDHKFRWDPSEYGGMKELYVPSEHIWLPDIVLYNKYVSHLTNSTFNSNEKLLHHYF